jgi:putative phosphoribosyl transferase
VNARFLNRRQAGQVLAALLVSYAGRRDLVVLGLPRGGIPVAHEVARSLGAPLDVFVVRKLGTPQQPELAMGAIASGGIRILNDDVVRAYHISPDVIEAVARREDAELARRECLYRDGRLAVAIEGKVAVLVDDGLATGSTMRAALAALRRLNPSRVIVAVPVGSNEACEDLRGLADEVVCARIPVEFSAVGLWYEDFDQTTDEEVSALLQDAGNSGASANRVGS